MLFPLPSTTSLLIWKSTFSSLSLKSEWKHALLHVLRAQCLLCSWGTHLSYIMISAIPDLPIIYREKNDSERSASRTPWQCPCVFKQCIEHSRHSINVSCRAKIGNAGTTTTTFISKKELFPAGLGSIFAHSSFWKDFSDSLVPLQGW